MLMNFVNILHTFFKYLTTLISSKSKVVDHQQLLLHFLTKIYRADVYSVDA